MVAISKFCTENIFFSPRHTTSSTLQKFSSRKDKSNYIMDIFDEFIQIYNKVPENKKSFFSIKSNENEFLFSYKEKGYLSVTVDQEIHILIKDIFFENEMFKFHTEFNTIREKYEKYSTLLNKLHESYLLHIDKNIPKKYRVEKKEFLFHILSLKECRENQIPTLISKNKSKLKHSFIMWKKQGINCILIKPMFKNKDEISSYYLAHGGFKVVKKTAILIHFLEENINQHISITPYVSVSQNVESDEIPILKNHELKNTCGQNFIASGFKEFRFYDPAHRTDRVIYLMPDLGFTIDFNFPRFHPHLQRDILLNLIDKCIYEKPNDIKISNTTLDQEGIPHFIDSHDTLFTYTPFLHPNGDYAHSKEIDFEHARILGLTYMFYQLINPQFMSRKKLSDILVFSENKEKSKDIHTGVRNKIPLSYELKKAYFSELTYSELRYSISEYFNQSLSANII